MHGMSDVRLIEKAREQDRCLAREQLLEIGFTDEMIDSFIDLKMHEVLRWEMAPSPVEFDMYYSA